MSVAPPQTPPFSGSSPETEGLPVCLKKIAHEGELDGFLYRSVMRQSYRNDAGIDLETVYSFPVSSEAATGGFSVRINGKLLEGELLPRETAEDRYEDALEEGDSPVLLSESSEGILTLSIGHLAPDDVAEAELGLLELVSYDGDQARLSVPTVLAPRSGDLHLAGELNAHESARCSPEAGYPLSVTVKIPWLGRGAAACCPSHVASAEPSEGGLVLKTAAGARPDRDYVLLLHNVKPPDKAACLGFYDPREDAWGRLALFHPEIPRDTGGGRVSFLFDASSTMEGAAWSQARDILLVSLLESCDPVELVSASFFNANGFAELELEPNEPVYTSKDRVNALFRDNWYKRDLAELFRSNFRDIRPAGEKGLARTLAAFAGPAGDGLPESPPLVLLTDCLEAGLAAMTDAARELAPRLFAVGLGHSPLAGHLRAIAEAAGSGGASLSSAPSEDGRQASRRLSSRIWAMPVSSVSLDWGAAAPLWSSPPPKALPPDVTCPAWALFKNPPSEAPKLVWTYLKGGGGDMAAGIPADSDGRDLPRLLARARLRAAERAPGPGEDPDDGLGGAGRGRSSDAGAEEALELALRHGILTGRTAWCLVYRRYPDQKATGTPALQQ
ncbi:MAG: hypothetical protein LBQ12_04445, partial [Deltaproteobacteria bacterium]|nr:hypothetical protein [Deltaproteobacteria bacterium]